MDIAAPIGGSMKAQSVANILSRHVKISAEGIDLDIPQCPCGRAVRPSRESCSFSRGFRGQPLPSAVLVTRPSIAPCAACAPPEELETERCGANIRHAAAPHPSQRFDA